MLNFIREAGRDGFAWANSGNTLATTAPAVAFRIKARLFEFIMEVFLIPKFYWKQPVRVSLTPVTPNRFPNVDIIWKTTAGRWANNRAFIEMS